MRYFSRNLAWRSRPNFLNLPTHRSLSFASQSDNSSVVNVVFVESKTGDKIVASGNIGKRVLDVALDHNVDIEVLLFLLPTLLCTSNSH